MMLGAEFFNQDACEVAKQLLGKVIYRLHEGHQLKAQIIETEAYYLTDKASHSSLGFTLKRRALFMPAGTIYMYYARGKDSLNVSCAGDGNAVLIKSAFPIYDPQSPAGREALAMMQRLNPQNSKIRKPESLLSGQTLLCQGLNIRVKDWDQKQFSPEVFCIKDTGYLPQEILVTTRLGIPPGRDEHLPYRFIDAKFNRYCTKPLKVN